MTWLSILAPDTDRKGRPLCFQERILKDVVIHICERTIQAHPVTEKNHTRTFCLASNHECVVFSVSGVSFVVITDECKVLIPSE